MCQLTRKSVQIAPLRWDDQEGKSAQNFLSGRERLERKRRDASSRSSLSLRSATPDSELSVNRSYRVEISARKTVLLGGCRHTCVKGYMQPRCCPQHWGPLCLSCPSWSGKTCNYHGTCLDGDVGNGTCVCDESFSGFACQECKNPNSYGENCDKKCDCEHGVCNEGPEGDGQCFCQPPYTGKRCDQGAIPAVRTRTVKEKETPPTANVCPDTGGCHRENAQCDVNAQCSSTGSKVSCTCKPDYLGDGKICVPRNLCSENNGGCPIDSTICVFKGPNKSSCECMFGMSPVGGNAEFGCQLVSACSADTCDPTAACQTGVDGQPKCVCNARQIGDGRRCYGNLMERLIELDRSGSQRGTLTGAVALFGKSCSMQLSQDGPFTAFIPLLKTPLTGVNEELVCQNHLIEGQRLYKELEGRDFNMLGGAKMRNKDNKKFILMDNPSKLYTIIQEDLPAANGIIHIIDQPMTNTLSDRSLRDEQFADKTIGEILTKDDKYNRFLSLVDNCGSPPPLRGLGPLTVFVPSNDAVDKSRDGSIMYMLNSAKYKLQELLRHHVFSRAGLTVAELATLPQIRTMANQIVTITVSEDGAILLGEKGIRLASTNIMASNGIIHLIDGLLFPPSILPILPHRCDVTESKITVGPCVHCSYLFETDCPEGTTELDSHQTGCTYIVSRLIFQPSSGCAKFCNATNAVAHCCKGFYGPDCKPCIGGFDHPCYDKGTCFDGIQGNGSCSCQSGFKGVACHICADPSKQGEKCDEECRCVHGVCDNRPGSAGVCRRGSCLEGYSGEHCDRMATPCNSDGQQEHCHIHAYCTHTGLENKCWCQDGYDGDGHSCSPINPCLQSSRGGCDTNARCEYAGPGNASCVCAEGWTGDGRVCVEINNCQLKRRGGCSPNADCNHIGPGQDGNEVSEMYFLFLSHILKVFSDCIEALEAKSFSITSVFKVMTELKGKLERRLKDTFFGFAVNNKLKQLTPDLAKKCEADFLVFYERAKKYVSERYDFSENSFHSKVSKLGLTTAVSYGEYSDAVQACSLKDIDMDGLYEEYGMLFMEGCHSEERYLKLFSKAEVPLVNLRKVSAYIFSIPCSNAHTERVFSMMTSAWRNERNRLDVDSVKAELQI
ncbi:hypothetical protein F7725_017454 [Dissostichus mawsoni]|uniref:Stabilin 2 n=1 Tax=Dissostichus mawsoni TaxID=36200 RepID=A0A7J5Z6F2_DISMA|nr:hypothetical protein F7725_017454 [Dissostichus mawsoni]